MKINSKQRKKRERKPNSSEFREGRKQKSADFNNHNKRLKRYREQISDYQ